MKIRIRKAPDIDSLEGFDLRPFDFRSGQVYDVSRRLAELLILWQHASLEPEPFDRDAPLLPAPRRRPVDATGDRVAAPRR